jgi:hypothetical protein
LIDHIRQTNPAQIIIAYTSARHNFAFQHFIDKADYRIPKSEDFAVFKRIVDESLDRRFSEDFYISRIEALLTADGFTDMRLRQRIRRAIWTRNASPIRAHLQRRGVDAQTIDRILAVCSIASNILILVKAR